MNLLRSHLTTRDSFGQYCAELGLTTYAVEIGTHHGMFASRFLSTWPGRHLVCIDPWQTALPDYPEMLWDRTPDMMIAMTNLAKFGADGRITVHRCVDSETVVRAIVEWCGPVDFAYIDGNHEYPFVKNDIALWWPHIRKGGILAGHDYFEPVMPGVVKAVDEFCEQENVMGYLVDESIGPSWYVRKPND